MRNLRSGRSLGRRSEADGGPAAITAGPVADLEHFTDSLSATLEAAAETERNVFVFRLHCCLIRLQRWDDVVPIADETVEAAIDERLMALEPSFVFHRAARRDIIGFSSQPSTSADAQRLGGRLAAGLSTALGPADRRFAVSPRLGVAILDQRNPSASDAIDAVTRTVGETNFETPYLVHNDYIRSRSAKQRQLAADLPGALERSEITVEFQPRVRADDLSQVGLEVLARWHRPDGCSVPAIEFLQVAERYGLLFELGQHVRATAVEVADDWAAAERLGSRRLWLDAAPVELCHPSFVPSVLELARDHPDVPIGFELSDTGLLDDPLFVPIFERLQEAGIQLALDNVKPSTLSIGRIQRLPTSMINLDGELVRALPTSEADRDLVRLLCSYAHEADRPVTACQVETDQELDIAKLLEVDLLQGRIIAEPVPPTVMRDLLRDADRPVAGR